MDERTPYFPLSRPRRRSRCAGFLLLEGLIALTLFSFCLLGLAMLHARAMAATHGSHLRSAAVVQLHDLAERMRMNREAPAGAYLAGGCPEGTAPVGGCSTTGCDPGALAAWDIGNWCAQTRALLGAQFVEASVSGAGGDYLISLELVERAVSGEGRLSIEPVELSLRVRP